MSAPVDRKVAHGLGEGLGQQLSGCGQISLCHGEYADRARRCLCFVSVLKKCLLNIRLHVHREQSFFD